MTSRKMFEKKYCNPNFIRKCRGKQVNCEVCYIKYLEKEKKIMLKALKKIRQHAKEAEQVCEMASATYDIVNNVIEQVSGEQI